MWKVRTHLFETIQSKKIEAIHTTKATYLAQFEAIHTARSIKIEAMALQR